MWGLDWTRSFFTLELVLLQFEPPVYVHFYIIVGKLEIWNDFCVTSEWFVDLCKTQFIWCHENFHIYWHYPSYLYTVSLRNTIQFTSQAHWYSSLHRFISGKLHEPVKFLIHVGLSKISWHPSFSLSVQRGIFLVWTRNATCAEGRLVKKMKSGLNLDRRELANANICLGSDRGHITFLGILWSQSDQSQKYVIGRE